MFGGCYTVFDAESDYDSPRACREIPIFDFWFTFVLFFLLLLLVSGRTTQSMATAMAEAMDALP